MPILVGLDSSVELLAQSDAENKFSSITSAVYLPTVPPTPVELRSHNKRVSGGGTGMSKKKKPPVEMPRMPRVAVHTYFLDSDEG